MDCARSKFDLWITNMPQIASVSRGALASTKINRISTEGASLTGVRVMSGNYVPGLTGGVWSSWIVDGIDRDYNTTTFKSRTNVTVNDGEHITLMLRGNGAGLTASLGSSEFNRPSGFGGAIDGGSGHYCNLINGPHIGLTNSIEYDDNRVRVHSDYLSADSVTGVTDLPIYSFRSYPGLSDVIIYNGNSTDRRRIPHNLKETPKFLFGMAIYGSSSGSWNWRWSRASRIGGDFYGNGNTSNRTTTGLLPSVPDATGITIGNDLGINSNRTYIMLALAADDYETYSTITNKKPSATGTISNTNGYGATGTITLDFEPYYIWYREENGSWRMCGHRGTNWGLTDGVTRMYGGGQYTQTYFTRTATGFTFSRAPFGDNVTLEWIAFGDTSVGTWDRQVTLSNPNIDTGSSDDRFGFGNAITDNYIIIGADLEDTSGNSNQGVIYVYEIVDESTITLRHTLTNPNSTGTSQFWGNRLDAYGDYIVVGDSTGNRVHVYQISTMSGSTISSADYTITESTASSSFADDVAIDRGWIVVGDPGVNNSNGCAYVYNISTFSASNITSPAYVLQNPYTNTGTADRMGQSVDIDKDQIVVSMSGYNETASSQGRMMLYDKSNFTTTNVSSPDAFYDNPFDQQYFGGPGNNLVAIHQDAGLAAVCHQYYDAGAGILQGRVYVTDFNGNLKRILESPDAAAAARFGTSCVFTPSGEQLIVTMQNGSQATYVYNTSTILAGLPSVPLTSADHKKISGNFSPTSVSANDTRFVVGSQTSSVLPQVFYKFQ